MTGREALKEVGGDAVVEALYARGFVCVPHVPTYQMIHEARYAALAEDAWREMVTASEITESESLSPAV